MVLAGLESIKSHNNFGPELESVNSSLKALDREQDCLLGWVLKGFPEKQIEREKEKINSSRTELLNRKAELELSLEQAQRAQGQIDNVKEACAIISQNLDSLSYEEKRLALEALNIKVWVDGYNLH